MSTRSATATATRPAHVAFVGAGPGDPALLTVAATELLARADTIVIDHLAREVLVERFARPDVTIVDAGTDSLSHGDHGRPLTHAAKAKLVVQAAKAAPGGLVVRLLDGDPAMFAGLAEEALACHKAKIGFDIVPGVSAVSAVPTYAGIPLTTSKSRSVHVCHGPESITDAVAADVHSTLVLLGTPDVLGATLARLLDAGRAPDTPVAITENGTIVRQRTIVTTLGECEGAVPQTNFPALAVVSPTVALRQELSWFETKPLFGWDVLVPAQQSHRDQAAAGIRANSSVVRRSVSTARTAPDGQGDQGWSPAATVDRVHLRQRGQGGREKFEENGLDARACRA